jgi:hypothetical protein
MSKAAAVPEVVSMKRAVEGHAAKRYGRRTLLLSLRFGSRILRVPYYTALK